MGSMSLKTSKYKILMRTTAILTNAIFKYRLMIYVNTWKMHNSINQYFPHDQCMMLQTHEWIKDPFKVQDRDGFYYNTACNVH